MFELGVIGVGNMGSSIVCGVLETGRLKGKEVALHDPNPDALSGFKTQYSVSIPKDQTELAKQSKIILLAVKPQYMDQVLTEIQDSLVHKPILVSIAAGKDLAFFEDRLGSQIPVIRVMPNLNARLGQSISALTPGTAASPEDLEAVGKIFECVGKTTVLPENQFPTFMALAGCSPAWIFRLIDSLATQAVAQGLQKTQAVKIVAQAVAGSALNVLHSLEQGTTPADLVDQVCSPGGTTVAGLLAMEEAGFSNSLGTAVKAAIRRDQQIK